MPKTILVVDDETSILQSLEGILGDEGFEVAGDFVGALKIEVAIAESGLETLKKIEETMPDLVLLDIWMPGMDGIETLEKIKGLYPRLQVIMMSGHGNIETAVKATKVGAYDYIEKPLSLEKLLLSISNALAHSRLTEEVHFLKEKEMKKQNIVGKSKAVSELKEQIRIVAPTNAWVLISGENGTGKELRGHTR